MENKKHVHPDMEKTDPWEYIKLAAVIALIFFFSLFYTGQMDNSGFMRTFMGIFFIVFGLFKLLDLKGFADSFRGYDIIAKKYDQYSTAYPFIELALGIGYLLNIPFISYPTLVLMLIGAVGVTRELLRGSKIKCACLGTYIKLPLTTVSLVEDLAMAAMALMLIINK